ncbi:MAG: hypothetical protein LBD23_19820 [Oscillospiraceae bacterium]|nr:hypothetical protein [Oscillospiraceae bacterium]
MDRDVFWGARTVFFGEADHGKSTLMGYLYAESQKEDLDKHKEELKMVMGSAYNDDDRYLYSSLISPIVPVTEGGLQRFSSKRRQLRDFVVDGPDPLVITMIDTPGHSRYLHHQEYGAARGKIGVFCLYIGSVLSNNFDISFIDRRTRLWFAANPYLKLIITLTQFDRENYNEDAYLTAKNKIESCLNPSKIKAIIPIAIDFRKRCGHNIFALSEKTPWYIGLCLIKAIEEQWYTIANMQSNEHLLPKNLVFSVDREFPRPLSHAGKIWRIYVENGELSNGKEIQLTSVEVKSDESVSTKELTSSVSAVVKEFRFDVCIGDEDELEESTSCKGSAVTINLKDCYAGRDKINKRQVFTTSQTVGLSKDEPFSLKNQICIRFEVPEDILNLSTKTLEFEKTNQEIILLIFGRGIPATITKISDDYTKVFVNLFSDKQITIPNDENLRSLDIFRRVIVRFQDGLVRIPCSDGSFREEPSFAYLPARIIYDETD